MNAESKFLWKNLLTHVTYIKHMFRNRIDFFIRLKICLQLNFVNVIHFLFFYIDRFFFSMIKYGNN